MLDNLQGIFSQYDRVLVFDTETTGLDMRADEIIQFSGVLLEAEGGIHIAKSYNRLISLAPGKTVPPKITELTGITNEALRTQGIPREQACREIAQLLEGNILLAAYNAHFDLTFLFYMLHRHGDASVLQGKDKLDLLTVYRDRRSYPHKLSSAIDAYQLGGVVSNSHSADDDALAAAYVMDAMAAEQNDLLCYLNIFGYVPKYGAPKPQIRSVTYLPQGYENRMPLYMKLL